MISGKVIGTATSTVRHPSLQGWKLLVVQPMAADCQSPDGSPLLAIDNLGAGVGNTVLISSDGRSTRQLVGSDTSPIRWCVLGIEDA